MKAVRDLKLGTRLESGPRSDLKKLRRRGGYRVIVFPPYSQDNLGPREGVPLEEGQAKHSRDNLSPSSGHTHRHLGARLCASFGRLCLWSKYLGRFSLNFLKEAPNRHYHNPEGWQPFCKQVHFAWKATHANFWPFHIQFSKGGYP